MKLASACQFATLFCSRLAHSLVHKLGRGFQPGVLHGAVRKNTRLEGNYVPRCVRGWTTRRQGTRECKIFKLFFVPLLVNPVRLPAPSLHHGIGESKLTGPQSDLPRMATFLVELLVHAA